MAISDVAVCVVVDENQDNRVQNQSANYKEHTVRQPVRVLRTQVVRLRLRGWRRERVRTNAPDGANMIGF